MYIRSASWPSTVLWAFHTVHPSSIIINSVSDGVVVMYRGRHRRMWSVLCPRTPALIMHNNNINKFTAGARSVRTCVRSTVTSVATPSPQLPGRRARSTRSPVKVRRHGNDISSSSSSGVVCISVRQWHGVCAMSITWMKNNTAVWLQYYSALVAADLN